MRKRERNHHLGFGRGNHGIKPPPTQPRPPAPPSQKPNRHSSTDYITELRLAVSRGELRFYEENGYIYVENTKGEAVILNLEKEMRN